MSRNSPVRTAGALIVVGLAVVSMAVIALGFLVPDRLFESGVGLASFLLATLTILICGALANLYDLRGILYDAFG